MTQQNWRIFTRDGKPDDGDLKRLFDHDEFCPPWRNFRLRNYSGANALSNESLPAAPPETDTRRGETFQMSGEMVEMVNAALYLRRPLLVTGKPGTGKSSLIYAVARQLGLGGVLRWPVNSRSALKDAIYSYDAIARLQDAQIEAEKERSRDLGNYLRLGPLGTALLPYARPRALLIDEIDKSDVDLPNDLLNIFEEGEYEIPELARSMRRPDAGQGAAPRAVKVRPHDSDDLFEIPGGRLRCLHFPFVILTSNGERDFSAPFLRRCLPMNVEQTDDEITDIVRAHLGPQLSDRMQAVIDDFLAIRKESDVATDRLLNAVFLVAREAAPATDEERKAFLEKLLGGKTRQ